MGINGRQGLYDSGTPKFKFFPRVLRLTHLGDLWVTLSAQDFIVQSSSDGESSFRFNVCQLHDCFALCRLLAEMTYEGGLFVQEPDDNPFWKLGGLFHWLWSSGRLGKTHSTFWLAMLRDGETENRDLWVSYVYLLCGSWVRAWGSKTYADGRDPTSCNKGRRNDDMVKLSDMRVNCGCICSEEEHCGVPVKAIDEAAEVWRKAAMVTRGLVRCDRTGTCAVQEDQDMHCTAAAKNVESQGGMEVLFSTVFREAMEETTRQWLSINTPRYCVSHTSLRPSYVVHSEYSLARFVLLSVTTMLKQWTCLDTPKRQGVYETARALHNHYSTNSSCAAYCHGDTGTSTAHVCEDNISSEMFRCRFLELPRCILPPITGYTQTVEALDPTV